MPLLYGQPTKNKIRADLRSSQHRYNQVVQELSKAQSSLDVSRRINQKLEARIQELEATVQRLEQQHRIEGSRAARIDLPTPGTATSRARYVEKLGHGRVGLAHLGLPPATVPGYP
jgi:chromosome segregation ATPase